jgi:hypothetical protein
VDFHLLLFAGFDRRTEFQEKRSTQSSRLYLSKLELIGKRSPPTRVTVMEAPT